jgi:hypothetical protein
MMAIKKYDLVIVLVVSLILGLGVIVVGLRFSRPAAVAPDSLDISSEFAAGDAVVETAVSDLPDTNEQTEVVRTDAQNVSDNTQSIIQVSARVGKDMPDVLLIYNSQVPSTFDFNFCELAEFYGALCETIDLNHANISPDMLKDENGQFYKLIGMSGAVFSPEYLNKGELQSVLQAVETGNSCLLVSKLNDVQSHDYVSLVTETAVTGVYKPIDSRQSWVISSDVPEITREFSGQEIIINKDIASEDFALTVVENENVIPLIQGSDDAGRSYPIFALVELGKGRILLDSGQKAPSLQDYPLTNAYYSQTNFTQVIPTMFAIRYALQDEAWHQHRNLVNFTIDDPPLWVDNPNHPLLKYLDYNQLLEEMETHNFHTTIAMPPHFWNTSEPEIVRLFLTYPNRFSLVQHGNNHDGFEFYRYQTNPGGSISGTAVFGTS